MSMRSASVALYSSSLAIGATLTRRSWLCSRRAVDPGGVLEHRPRIVAGRFESPHRVGGGGIADDPLVGGGGLEAADLRVGFHEACRERRDLRGHGGAI